MGRGPATAEVPYESLVVPVVLTAVYFVTLFGSLLHAVVDLPWSLRRGAKDSSPAQKRSRLWTTSRNVAIAVYALAAAVLAWYHIFDFMAGDRAGYPSTAQWVAESSWFVKAYERVTATPAQWFWSSQLLQGVGTIVVFTFVESTRCAGIRALSSFWLGCSAAISLAFPLFIGGVWNTPSSVYRARLAVPPSRLLVVGVFASSMAVVLLPRVESTVYGPVLGTVHVALLVPLALRQLVPELVGGPATDTAWLAPTYGALAAVSATTHVFNALDVLESAGSLRGFVLRVSGAFCANACQCSISGDVILTSVMAGIFMLADRSPVPFTHRAVLLMAMPALSFGGVFAAFLALREMALHRLVAEAKAKGE